ncbi:Uncharacterised protein [uncultured archaeon]|nr:Uncharacterised protein [uncultured archaeon]
MRTSDGTRIAMEKGQGVMFDFAFALLLFVIAWAFISSSFDSRLSSHENERSFAQMKNTADSLLDSLVSSNGVPGNWEENDAGGVKSIGLALRDRELSEAKLAAFSNSDYEALKEKMNIGANEFFFTFSGPVDMNAGLPPQGKASVAVSRRVVSYNGQQGTVALKIYRLVD